MFAVEGKRRVPCVIECRAIEGTQLAIPPVMFDVALHAVGRDIAVNPGLSSDAIRHGLVAAQAFRGRDASTPFVTLRAVGRALELRVGARQRTWRQQ